MGPSKNHPKSGHQAGRIKREKELEKAKQEFAGLNSALIDALKHEKELSARLEMANEDIADANRQLSMEIDTRKKVEAELARSNTELEQFASIASHDLQEPLRMVGSYLQLLKQRYAAQLDANAQEYIGFAVDGANRMKILITNLLNYSRIGTRGSPFAPAECETAFKQAVKNLEIAIAEKQAQVIGHPLPTVMADQNQLVQLFQNLIGNAIKFCKEKTPEVHVSAKPENKHWLFSVKDNGIGIAPEQRERIFQIFQRLHTREEYEGTGIGLAVCKKIVERHDGTIWVESEPGKGTTFLFTIPGTA
ncbi:MAG: ATP-binding protein [Fibrobacterota bacterium]